MRLKFYAKAEHCVHMPGPKYVGVVHNYAGRQFVPHEDEKIAQATRIAGQNRATKEGFEIDSETPEGRDMAHAARCGGLWTANRETAQAVGADFVPVRYDEKAFEFVIDTATHAKPSKLPAQSE